MVVFSDASVRQCERCRAIILLVILLVSDLLRTDNSLPLFAASKQFVTFL